MLVGVASAYSWNDVSRTGNSKRISYTLTSGTKSSRIRLSQNEGYKF